MLYEALCSAEGVQLSLVCFKISHSFSCSNLTLYNEFMMMMETAVVGLMNVRGVTI